MRNLRDCLKAKQKQRDKYRNINTKELKKRYAQIINGRFRGDTLEELGNRFGVTRERIRQMEESVLNKDLIVYKEKARERRIDETKRTTKKPIPLIITLEAARANKGKTATDIAKELNVNVGTLRGWELGKTKVPLNQYNRLLRIYNIPPQNIKGNFEGSWFRAEI